MSFTIKKSDKVEIRGSITEYEGERYFDLRTFVLATKGEHADEFIPTQKGVSIPISMMPELEAGIQSLKTKKKKSNGQFVLCNKKRTRFYSRGKKQDELVFTKNIDKAFVFSSKADADKFGEKLIFNSFNGDWQTVNIKDIQ